MMFQEKLLMNKKPFKILGIEHIGVAKKNIDGIDEIFLDILDLNHIGSEEIKDQQVITDIFDTGMGKIEFLQSTNPNSPISNFIKNKGEGIHHIALLVDHLQLALDYLKTKGIKLIDEAPRIGAEGLSIAFLHPKSTGGILIELCEKK